MIKQNISRRTWLKRGALATGALMSGMVLPNTKPAFGMKPFKGHYNLREMHHIAPPGLEGLRARLLANENPWGPSKKAIAAIAESASSGNRYVYRSARFQVMMDMLAEKEGVPADHIMLAPGSTDILEKMAFMQLRSGGNVISGDPSYMSLINTATKLGATWKNIKLNDDYTYDLDSMEKAVDDETKLVYICNPNNPTGTFTSPEKIKSFCKRVSSTVPVFLDEAYLDLLDDPGSQTTIGLVKEGYDVVVCRTFSKIHGLAGLRMGYMVAQPERIEELKNMVRTEMGLCVTTLEAAIASLQDTEFQDFTRTHNKENREYVFEELQKSGMSPIPSCTNFILFPIQMTTEEFLSKMYEKGVGIRGFEIFEKPYARVSMGKMDEVKLFVKSLNEIVS